MLTTPRLTLRQPDHTNLETVKSWFSHPDIMRFQGGIQTEEQIQTTMRYMLDHWREYGFGHYLIFIKNQITPIGLVSLKYITDADAKNKIPDLGFMVHPQFWKNGFATEAALAVLKHAKVNLGLSQIQALNYPDNHAGCHILIKLGFQTVGQKQVVAYGRNLGVAATWEIDLANV